VAYGHALVAAPREAGTVGLTLTGEFELVVGGRRLAIPHSAERVVAYLALVDRPVARSRLAGALWLNGSERAAAKSLRTALWRLHCAGADVVVAASDRLRLQPTVIVDFNELADLAWRLIHAPDTDVISRVHLLVEGVELLPDWEDEWVIVDRERFRLLRLEALERSASALLSSRQLGDALIAALAAVHAEPLRESARRILIQIHIAHGNLAEAIRSYREYGALLRAEFGVGPSSAMKQLLGPLYRGGTAG
jgi:DNA-binding SARP family transcriptional activator